MSVLGDNLKKFREKKGYTQKQLAEIVGKSKNVISNWENGVNKPDPDTIETLLGALDVDANTLLGWDNPEQLKSDADALADKILSNKKIQNLINMISSLSESDIDLVANFVQRLSDK